MGKTLIKFSYLILSYLYREGPPRDVEYSTVGEVC